MSLELGILDDDPMYSRVEYPLVDGLDVRTGGVSAEYWCQGC